MKPQPLHFIAAPFLALSGYLLFEFSWTLGALFKKDWISICLMTLLSVIAAGVPAALGMLALKRRWEDFVKIVAVFAFLPLFALLAGQTNRLNKTVEAFSSSPYSMLTLFWGLCVTVAPLVICIVVYQRLVPLILRRIARSGVRKHELTG